MIFLLKEYLNDLGYHWSLLKEANHRHTLRELKVIVPTCSQENPIYYAVVNHLFQGELRNVWSIKNLPSVFNEPTLFKIRWDHMDWDEQEKPWAAMEKLGRKVWYSAFFSGKYPWWFKPSLVLLSECLRTAFLASISISFPKQRFCFVLFSTFAHLIIF